MSQQEYIIEADQILKMLPKRQSDANKGTYGKLLAAAGSDGMAGAALLCATAAYRTGCGLVYVLTPEKNRVIIQSQLPEAVYLRRDGDVSEQLKSGYSAAVVGPGLSKGPEAGALLKAVLETLQVPLVLDADALNLIAQDPTMSEAVKRYPGGIIMTPHRGEMARLLKTDIECLKADPVGTAKCLAEQYHCVCVAKDARTVVYAPGREAYVCTDGNDGMATGGSGDVLAGVIGGLLAQDGTDLYRTAVLGVYVHARAGDAAAARLGKRFMLARDIIEGMCEVLK
jgi:NAD(P)H-hydrate epimerase